MSDSDLLQKTRKFLLGLAALMFGATILELIFAEHTDGLVQLIPFVVCATGLVMLAVIWARPEPRTLRVFRVVMGLIIAVSLFGMLEHLESAIDMARDFHPGLSGVEFWKTVLTSSTPILAPGVLAATALVALVSTYGLQLQPHAAPQQSSLHGA